MYVSSYVLSKNLRYRHSQFKFWVVDLLPYMFPKTCTVSGKRIAQTAPLRNIVQWKGAFSKKSNRIGLDLQLAFAYFEPACICGNWNCSRKGWKIRSSRDIKHGSYNFAKNLIDLNLQFVFAIIDPGYFRKHEWLQLSVMLWQTISSQNICVFQRPFRRNSIR